MTDHRLHTKKVPVTCTHCHHEQTAEIYAKGTTGQVKETVVCDKCKKPFYAMLPDEIVSGEFIG